jgi:23S rRNA G2069 N7-methylase RlmK/C1962 C5-methylase RlmI
MSKQTAVELLEEEFKKNGVYLSDHYWNCFDAAKQFEKEQIVDAKNDMLYPIIVGGIQYYNETYGGQDE